LTPDAGSGPELALDTLVIGSLAPTATIDITRFDPTTSLVFPLLQELGRSQDAGSTPDVLAFTVGDCENSLGGAELALAEWLLAAIAATGTTPVAATGDQGSSACAPQSDAPAVQYPAASPWVTSVGGASFAGSVTDPSDLTVWNDTPTQQQASGGGTSSRLARPSWQKESGSGVAVPDVVAYAEPSGFGALPVCTTASDCTWQQLGGTSLATAGLAGLLAQAVATTGARYGALTATLGEAGNGGRAPAIDVTVGNNHVATTTCCTAKQGFDLASGWGLFVITLLPAADQA
jgi:kumamolisin